MDERRFDRLSRRIFRLTNRRTTLAGLAGLLAVLAGWLPGRRTGAQQRPNLCRPLGGVCFPGRGIGCCGNVACRQGKCRCGRKQRACHGHCISRNRCCHNRDCGRGQVCRQNRCQCQAGHLKRGRRCVPRDRCSPGRTRCGGHCVNLMTAKQHCGECGLACAGTAVCKQGVCVAGGVYREVRRFGADDLNVPFGIAVDRAGMLYVTESDVSYRIAKFTGNGTFVTSWPAVGDNPVGIDITSAGQIYTSNFDSDNVQTYSRDGTVGHSFPTSDRPNGLAVGPGGVVYVAFSNLDAVHCFNLAGDLIATWRGAPYRFSAPVWTAVAPNGDVYVTNHFSREVVWVSAAGEVKGRWGGAEPGQIRFPHGVTVDGAGFVYVVDRRHYRVQKYTASGDFVGAFGEFARPDEIIDVAVSRTGMVYVTLPLDDHVIVQFEPA